MKSFKALFDKAKSLDKNKKIAIAVLCVGLVVFAASIIGLLISTEKISLRKPAAPAGDLSDTAPVVSLTVSPEMKNLKAVWFSPFEDLTEKDLSREVIAEHLEAVKSLGFNAVITPLSIEGEKKIINIGETAFDAAGIVADEAKSKGLFLIGSIDSAYYFGKNESSDFDFEAVRSIFAGVPSADALLLKDTDKLTAAFGSDEDNRNALTPALKGFSERFKSSFAGKFCGFSVSSDTEAQDAKHWAESGLADFILVNALNSTANKDMPFTDIADLWNSFNSPSFIYFSHRLDLLREGKEGFDSSSEIIKQAEIVKERENLSGSAFYSYREIREDLLSCASSVASFFSGTGNSEIAAKELEITSPATKKVTTDKSKISFTGVSDPSSLVFLNGKPIERTADGLFSLDLTLKPGVNTFVFTHKGKELKYTVNYEIDLLQEVSPSDKTTAPVGTKIEIAAYAKKGANVYAVVGNAKVQLKATESDLFGKGEGIEDFATFMGTYTLPKINSAKQSLGKIVVYAEQGGFVESLQGGEIIVTDESNGFSEFILSDSDLNSASLAYPYRNLKNPFTDHSLGRDKLCVVTAEYAEATALSEPSDKSDPKLTPLLKGSIDYVTGRAIYNGKEHYILKSGRKIYAKDAKLVANAYKMPLNNLRVIRTTNGKTTDIYLKTDWLVPINAELKPQSYYVGFEDRPFNVSTFTASFIDFIFYHTNGVAGLPEFSDNSVLKSAQWLTGKSDKTLKVLRLNLRETGKFYGYKLSVTDEGYIKISFKRKPETLSGMTIMLDPGHGGKKDPGTFTVYPNLYEKEINMKLALIMKRELEAKGAKVIFTRTQDVYLAREDRALFAKQKNPDLYVSIHCDGSTSSSLSGTHSFYYRAFSKPLAESIHKELVSAYRNTIYAPDTKAWQSADRGVKFKPFNVTRIEECPAVLIEFGFLTNASDCNVLINPQYQEVLAKAAVKGIENYVLKQ
ncbi:MAG TPA: N-acetylmuramoyl-L-alanine amidase [Clostridiales bacterium]|nr:N-acetylmuramoyl-L-alanine amidase [Clostridiales bacterium]HPU66932.1 N-acetylmuramoyl-L-alanine amidase [Clostridiales bacterium]HXK83663.1 N-acetylmuramoyl-L-alanine amidase [Clostridiales bacterium]